MTTIVEQIARIPDPMARLDRYMELQGGRIVSAADPDIMLLFGYDLPEADTYLLRWAQKHANDCDVLALNPIHIKVYGTVMPDRENRALFDKRQQRRQHANRKASERREWDGF